MKIIPCEKCGMYSCTTGVIPCEPEFWKVVHDIRRDVERRRVKVADKSKGRHGRLPEVKT